MSQQTNKSTVFSHERLEVYQYALQLARWVQGLGPKFPRGRAPLRDQITRATEGVVLNLREAAPLRVRRTSHGPWPRSSTGWR